MADPRLQATLTAVDRFSRVVRRANESLRPLKIRAEETQRAFKRLSRETGLGQLVRTLRAASGPMQRFGAAARRAAGPLGVITGGGVVLGLASMTTGYAQTGDEVAKFARTVGVSVEGLQAFRFAAGRQGASAEALNKGFVRLNAVVGELKSGTGELRTFLDEVSPSLRDALANSQNTEEAFKLLSEAVANTEDPFMRATLVQRAFGRGGADLINLLSGGTAGLAELRREYAALGGVISSEAAAETEVFQDRMLDLKTASLGLRNAIGGGLIPVLTPLIADLTEWIAANRELIGQKVGGFVTRLVEVVSQIDFETVKIAAAAFAAVMAGPLLTGIVGVIGTIGTLASVLAANPILLLVAGLGAAAVTLVRNWDDVKAFFVDLWASIEAGARAAFEAIGQFLNARVLGRIRDLSAAFGNIVGGVADFLGIGDDRAPALPNAGRPGAVQSAGGEVQVRIMGENLPQGTRLAARGRGRVRTDVTTDDLLGAMQ